MDQNTVPPMMISSKRPSIVVANPAAAAVSCFGNRKTFGERMQCVWRNITVEPLLAFYIIPSVLTNLATQNLNLEKACRVNLNYDDVVCDALSRRETANYTAEEQMVQQLVASMAGWKTILQSGLPCLLILFWGSWSDRHRRRKPCMLIPIFGELITSIGLLLCTYFEAAPVEVAAITETLFTGLTGGWFTMLMGVFSYVADITTKEERTLRIGIVNLCISLGVPVGMAFSGILLKQIGFYGMFSLAASMHFCSLMYGIFGVNEPSVVNANMTKKPVDDRSLLADFFDKAHVVETFRVAFKNGARQRRLRVIMLIIVVMVVDGPLYGEMSVFYLFTRYQFNFSAVQFSLFSTYSMLTGLIGTMFSVGVFSHTLKIEDSLIGVMSSMSKILSSFVYAFAQTSWQLYLAPIVEILNGTSFIAMRSIASKLVSSDELGKVNSLFGVAEALVPLIYSPLYAAVYAATMDTLPGAFFLLGGAMTVPAVAIFFWMYHVHKRDLRNGCGLDSDSPPTSEEKSRSNSSDKPPHYCHQNGSSSVQQQQELYVPATKRKQPATGGFGQVNAAFVADSQPPPKHNSSSTVTAVEVQSTLPASGNSIVREISELHHLDHCKL